MGTSSLFVKRQIVLYGVFIFYFFKGNRSYYLRKIHFSRSESHILKSYKTKAPAAFWKQYKYIKDGGVPEQMAYWIDTYDCGYAIENELKYVGNYGAKGEKRAPHKKATTEQIKKQNHANKIKKVRREIMLNFHPWDLWLTLKYPRGTRKTTKEVLKDAQDWTEALREKYKKAGEQLKWIRRIEIGRYGGIHVHILINRPRTMKDVDLVCKELWGKAGINFQSLKEEGGYDQLASYICKKGGDTETEGQLSFLPEEDRKRCLAYSTSRNLIRPEDVRTRKKYSHWTMRKIIMEGPKPREGYYIDKNSIRTGINPFTGMSYFYYTEIRIKGKWENPDKGDCG